MSNPDTQPRSTRFGFRAPARGWSWAARLLPAVLACAFAGAGQAQEAGKLDDVVRELTLGLVNEADLRNKKVLVKSDDFFELKTELRLELSEVLRGMAYTWLGRHGVPVAKDGSDEDAVRVLHGKWRRESDTVLNLELSVATPVKDGDPTALMTRYGRVLIDESIRRAIQSTPEDWGRLLVLRLERGVRDQQVRTVHVQPMTIGGDEGQGEELEGFLRSWLGSALVESRLFRLVDPPPGVAVETDGKLYVESALRAGHVEVSLLVSDSNTWQRVTFAKVEMDRKLFPPGMFGPDVRGALARCASEVDAGRLEAARECYERVRAGAPGDSDVGEGVRTGLERIAGLEERARVEAAVHQGFMVHKSLGVSSAKELDGASVCIQTGTTTELNLADYFHSNGMKYEAVTIETNDEARQNYLAGRCDVYTTDASGLASTRSTFSDPENHVILPERICCIREGMGRRVD